MWKDHLAALANDCHSPEDGRFCSTGGGVDLSDLDRFHKERVPGLKRMLAVVDTVIDIPSDYPKARVEIWDGMGGAAGSYLQSEKLIRLAEDSPFNASTIVHELGHHLSLAERGQTKMEFLNETYNDPNLREMDLAMRETPQWKRLFEAQGKGNEQASYMLDKRETFARIFTQYVAWKSGSGVLKFQIDAIQEKTQDNYHWDWNDFPSIGVHMDNYFKEKGWVK